MHIDASLKAPSAKARLMSPQFRNSGSRCLNFWYHMHGMDINRLNVYLANSTNPISLGTPIWTRYGEQGLIWLNAEVELGAVDTYVKVCDASFFFVTVLDNHHL